MRCVKSSSSTKYQSCTKIEGEEQWRTDSALHTSQRFLGFIAVQIVVPKPHLPLRINAVPHAGNACYHSTCVCVCVCACVLLYVNRNIFAHFPIFCTLHRRTHATASNGNIRWCRLCFHATKCCGIF